MSNQRLGLVVLIALLTLPVSMVRAATLAVTDCGDTTPGGGPGQLRKLINDAVSGDTISVPACTITLTGAAGDDANLTGDLDITKSLTIQGQGAASSIIDGGALDRVFHINPANNPNVTVTLAGLTIRNGSVTGPSDGGGIFVPNSNSSLTLRDSVLTGNATTRFGRASAWSMGR
jgi:hypothetical protein